MSDAGPRPGSGAARQPGTGAYLAAWSHGTGWVVIGVFSGLRGADTLAAVIGNFPAGSARLVGLAGGRAGIGRGA